MPRLACRAWVIVFAAAVAMSEARADDVPKAGRHPIPRSNAPSRAEGSSSSSMASFLIGGVAVILAGFGAFTLIAKRTRSESTTAGLRVVGRVSLSPRHAVYLVRVGDRTLILGTGGQGPPSILGEMPTGETIEPKAATPGVLPLRAGGAA
jgi:flagellar protein FliO/FliZ